MGLMVAMATTLTPTRIPLAHMETASNLGGSPSSQLAQQLS
jgi:hypothetical protein